MCPLQGRCGRSEIQASHVPSAGQTRPGQGDPGLTRAHCPVDVAGEVQSRPHTCPLRGRRGRGSEIQASHLPTAGQRRPGQRDQGLTHAHCRAEAAGAARSRPHTCPLRGRRSRGSEIQASHAPSEGRGGRGSKIQASHAPSEGRGGRGSEVRASHAPSEGCRDPTGCALLSQSLYPGA